MNQLTRQRCITDEINFWFVAIFILKYILLCICLWLYLHIYLSFNAEFQKLTSPARLYFLVLSSRGRLPPFASVSAAAVEPASVDPEVELASWRQRRSCVRSYFQSYVWFLFVLTSWRLMRIRHWRDRESCWCLTMQSTCPGKQNSLFSFIQSVSSLLFLFIPSNYFISSPPEVLWSTGC